MNNKKGGSNNGELWVIVILSIAFVFAFFSIIVYERNNEAAQYPEGNVKCHCYSKKKQVVKAIKKAVRKRKKTIRFYYVSEKPRKYSYFTRKLFYIVDGIKYTEKAGISSWHSTGKWNVNNKVCHLYNIKLNYYFTRKQEKRFKK